MDNLTDVDVEIGKIMYRQGLEWGKQLKHMIDEGLIDPDKTINLVLPIGNIDIKNFSYKTRFLLAFGSPAAGVVKNSGIVAAACYTGTNSLIGYHQTTDPIAKACYAISVLCSSTAFTSGGMAVAARECNMSGLAFGTEAVGGVCMYLGNIHHVQALYLEGKPIPPRLYRYLDKDLRRLPGVNNGLGFVTPSGINSIFWNRFFKAIPVERIGRIVGIGLSVYGYTKLVVVSYRYGQQLIAKFKSNKKSALVSSKLKNRIRSVKIQFLSLWVTSRLASSVYDKPTRLYRVWSINT